MRKLQNKKRISHSNMAKKSKKMQLVELYRDCIALDNKLEINMQELSKIATEIYGKELRASICDGSEIEFRKFDENGFVDASSTILIEEIIAKITI